MIIPGNCAHYSQSIKNYKTFVLFSLVTELPHVAIDFVDFLSDTFFLAFREQPLTKQREFCHLAWTTTRC